MNVLPSFDEEVKTIQSKVGDLSGRRFFSSPLKRCKLLAEALSSEPRKIFYDPRLLELSFGNWENKKWGDLPQHEMNYWMENFVMSSAPEGETFLELYERVSDFWDELMMAEVDDAVVVSHSGPMHTIVAHILEIPLENVYSLKMHYGQLLKLERRWNGKFEIEFC